jgi:1-aminocyclopropane-1-carboxylate deaminase
MQSDDSLDCFLDCSTSIHQKIDLPFNNNIALYLKREDLLHNSISGNKFRKLKYNLLAAQAQQQHTLLTFGGAYSNHIAAVAAAGKQFGFNTIGIIRGEELADKIHDNKTLQKAQANGMQLHFISRSAYRDKQSLAIIESLKQQFGEFYLIPEGGSNSLAVQGCSEILSEQDKTDFDYICCAVGTGGTIAGIIQSAATNQKVLGFPALKGIFLFDEIRQWLPEPLKHSSNWDLNLDYHCGGYAKITAELTDFVAWFYQHTGIEIEPIYTGKMLFGIFDLIKKDYFPANSQILAIHTGGLQGKQHADATLK